MANIKDIAKKAGVSVATVSRVINNKKDVSEAMRSYIMKIIDDAGYVPNAIAKNLSHGRSNLIAVMLPTLDTPFFSELLTEIESEAGKQGYNVLMFNSSDNRTKVDFYLNSMKSNFVCGAIINSLVVTSQDIEALESSGIKTITFDRTPANHLFSSIKVEHRKGGQLATGHLIDEGYKNPLMISGESQDKVTHERMLGFCDLVTERLDIQHPLVVNSNLTSSGGYETTMDLLKKGHVCDAIFCANDAMAFGAARACADSGYRVPEDIAVMGYDNSSMCEFYVPRLSSVDQRLKEVGKLAVETMVSLIRMGSEPLHLTVSPELVIRESTQR